ncbi:MAG: hypothetical protein HFE76_14225 [Firmicutes bacterium]|nr:hypothetical protein [Bacillota bacterium]
MNSKLFSQAMNQIDSKYIQEALLYQGKTKKPLWLKWSAAAACLAITIFAIVAVLPQKEPETSPKLPQLSISEHTSDGMGFEGYMAYKASELANANPWNESLELSALPVYQNSLTYDADGISGDIDFDRMREVLLETAGRLGLDTKALTITDDTPDEKTKQEIREKFQATGDTVPEGYFNPTKLTAKAGGVEIEVGADLTASIFFEPAVSLPQEYNFTNYASYEDLAAAAEYLKTKYKDVIGFDKPRVNISGGDYTNDGRQGYSLEFFNAEGSAAQQIVNYNLSRVAFSCDDNGKLSLVRIYRPDLSRKAGDYPIITSSQARELLANGSYITSVPYEMPGLEYVKKTELVYRTGSLEAYYMPYYCFYVELPQEEQEKKENGLKTYGAYYVPAVDNAYISNMPAWDGSFN